MKECSGLRVHIADSRVLDGTPLSPNYAQTLLSGSFESKLEILLANWNLQIGILGASLPKLPLGVVLPSLMIAYFDSRFFGLLHRV